MKAKTILITTLILMLLGYSGAFAWGPHGGGKYHGGNDGPPCVNKNRSADLTDEQREELAGLRESFMKDTAEMRIDLHAKSARLNVLLDETNPDTNAINALVDEVSGLRATLMKKRIDHVLAAKEVAPAVNFGSGFHGYNGMGWSPGAHAPCNARGAGYHGEGFGCPGRGWR